MGDDEIIPVRVVTARKQHPCFECLTPILPGDRYELHVMPPHRSDVIDLDHWHVARVHWPRWNGGWLGIGCDEAAAYREKARREQVIDLGYLSLPADVQAGIEHATSPIRERT